MDMYTNVYIYVKLRVVKYCGCTRDEITGVQTTAVLRPNINNVDQKNWSSPEHFEPCYSPVRPESTYSAFTFILPFHLPLNFQNNIFFAKVALLRKGEANEN
jgi:hypothetical protein